MKIRRAAEHELLELWGYERMDTASSNAKFFCGKEGMPNFGRWIAAESWLGSCMFSMTWRTRILQMANKPHISALFGLGRISVVRDSGQS